MKFLFHITIISILLSSYSEKAIAQKGSWHWNYEKPKGAFKNLYLWGGLSSAKINISFNNGKFDPHRGSINTERLETQLSASSAYTFGLGVKIPIVRTGNTTSVLFDVEGSYTSLLFNTGVQTYGTDKSFSNYDVPINFMSLPLGVSFARGADAILDKSYKFSYSLGTGFALGMYQGEFGKYSASNYAAVPYIRAEVGFLAGMLIKFRADIKFADYNLINSKGEGHLSEPMIATTNTLVRLSPITTVGLMIYPASGGYKKSSWWK